MGILVSEELAGKAVKVINQGAKIGRFGDGKIIILSLKEAVRIRRDEVGTYAF